MIKQGMPPTSQREGLGEVGGRGFGMTWRCLSPPPPHPWSITGEAKIMRLFTNYYVCGKKQATVALLFFPFLT